MTLDEYNRIFKYHGYYLLLKLSGGDSINCFYALERIKDKKRTDYQLSDLKRINDDLFELIKKMKEEEIKL